ncbi:MAG: RNA polymerase sigma-70 factor [Flammeovirgaceae bacterium]
MPKEPSSEDHLILEVKQGNESAFRKLFDKFYKLLLAVAINFLKDIDAAKDVVQEVFFQLWKKRESLNINSSVEAYLKRAVINKSLNQIKYQKRLTGDDNLEHQHSSSYTVVEELQAAELHEALQQALDSLPERCRLIFVMRRLEGMSHKEIAEKLEISPKTIENQMTKALKVLKEAVRVYEEKSNGQP